jgi:23S rRNA (pseudouridine1915-N3)-methyltransferase
MLKIKIFSIGKTKEPWLQEASEEYQKRIKNHIQVDWILCKNDEQLTQTLEKEGSWISLDPKGKLYSSEEFSSFLFHELEKEGSRLNFVIGGAEGLPKQIRDQSKHLISLSPMTFTHQMTRLIILEQIYRALEIRKGSGYHK